LDTDLGWSFVRHDLGSCEHRPPAVKQRR
jgi:hypothetical protein